MGMIDPEDVQAYDQTMAAQKKKKDKIIVKSLGGGAKGGYRAKKRRVSAIGIDPGFGYGAGGIDPSKIKPAQTSGLTKDFGGTPIGIASGNMFNTLSEVYNRLNQEGQFIDNPQGTYSGQR